jgi:GH24 family phage-related lysozyme (muramidase)
MEVGVAPWRLVRLASPTLLKDLNVGRYADAGEQLLLWVNAGGKPQPRLVACRQAELVLWMGSPN